MSYAEVHHPALWNIDVPSYFEAIPTYFRACPSSVWALFDGRLLTEVRMRRLTVLLTVAVFVVLIAADGLAQAPSALGTWTLNVAKSTYDPGPAPKSQTTIQSGVPGGG